MQNDTLAKLSKAILDEASSSTQLASSLDKFASLCSKVSGVQADVCYNAWAPDTFLENGVAINPQAAAQCVKDYHRSVMFIRGVYAAISKQLLEKSGEVVSILYAGCGPYATLLLPLLEHFHPDQLEVYLLDVHQESLDSVSLLLKSFQLSTYNVTTLHHDACKYQHPVPLDIILTETMQKSLEQEPQFSVTANLAQQLKPSGTFIPQEITASLCLLPIDSHCDEGESELSGGTHIVLAKLLALKPETTPIPQAVATKSCSTMPSSTAPASLEPLFFTIPSDVDLANYYPAITTHIQVFESFYLEQGEADITLPRRCIEVEPLNAKQTFSVQYELGQYPRFAFYSARNIEPEDTAR